MTREEAHDYLEDVQRLITQWRHLFPEKLIEANGQAILALEQPEIIRCKECKWFAQSNNSKYPEDYHCSYDNSDFSTNHEGFCYNARRREDGQAILALERDNGDTDPIPNAFSNMVQWELFEQRRAH